MSVFLEALHILSARVVEYPKPYANGRNDVHRVLGCRGNT